MTSASASAFDDVISFYRAASYVSGQKRERGAGNQGADGADPVSEPPEPEQAAYSVNWFFENCAPARLGPVARAFLGEEGARAELSFRDVGPLDADDPRLLERMPRKDGSPGFPLNRAQRTAVARALANPLSLVQGPAGTGKTETILNMASVMLAEGGTVAVVSNNSSALENIAIKIAEMERGCAGLPNRARLARSFAALGSSQRRKDWSEAHPVGLAFRTQSKEERAALDHGCGGWEAEMGAATFLARYPMVASTIHSIMKCFADGETYRYDYLIMDEASQCNVMLGVLALSCAEHVVLVGDTEQLAPVWNDALDESIAARAEAAGSGLPRDDAYLLKAEGGDGMSILEAAERIFAAGAAGGVPKTFLDEHFRCHPGIIGFCRDEVYTAHDERLKICTAGFDEGVQVPVRVRWFEGDYCESRPPEGWEKHDDADALSADGGLKGSKRNRRQLEVFMREEWPALSRRLEEDPGLSVCVLSPFNGQLIELKGLLAEELGEGEVDTEGTDQAAVAGDGPVTALTIHKSQGQEFDIVYLLPVEDGVWEWPWSQGKRLVNVAVSRAKRELVVITSSQLMDTGLQEALGARVTAGGPEEGDLSEEELKEREDAEHQRLYVQRLLRYVWDRREKARAAGSLGPRDRAFGFFRSGLASVFDARVELWGRPSQADRAPDGEELSSSEAVVKRALEGMGLGDAGLAFSEHAPLARCLGEGELARLDEEQRAFVEGRAHFDFLVYEREGGRLVAAVEVDGGGHRARRVSRTERDSYAKLRRRMRNDELKDAIVEALGGRVMHGNAVAGGAGGEGDAPFALLRLPDDGSCAFETRALREKDERGLADGFVTIEETLRRARAAGGFDIVFDITSEEGETMNTDENNGKDLERAERLKRYAIAIVKDQPDTALAMFKQAIELGSADAALEVAHCGIWGSDEHFKMLQTAVLMGNALGLVDMANIFATSAYEECLDFAGFGIAPLFYRLGDEGIYENYRRALAFDEMARALHCDTVPFPWTIEDESIGERIAIDWQRLEDQLGDNYLSVTNLMKEWRSEDDSFPKIRAADANERLQAAGIIQHSPFGWVATEEGRNLGIFEKAAIQEGKKPQFYCVYPKDAPLREVLTGEQPTPVNKPEIVRGPYSYLVSTRGVTRLIHFTPLENLESILTHGLLTKGSMDKLAITPEINDDMRWETLNLGVAPLNLSIEYPNARLLYTFRKQHPDRTYVVLSIDPKVLNDPALFDVGLISFYNTNAATSGVRSCSVEKLFAPNELFVPPRPDSLPSRYASDVQAEVLVNGTIDKRYITGIYFNYDAPDAAIRDARRIAREQSVSCPVEIDRDVFNYSVYKELWGIE